MKKLMVMFLKKKIIYNSHQWVILSHKIAKDYLRLSNIKDTESKNFIRDMRHLYKDNGVSVGKFKATYEEDNSWIGGCPD